MITMAEQNGNGSGNGKPGNFWSGLVNIAASGILLATLWMFWQVANPNPRLDKIDNEINSLRGSYLSLREHEEYQARYNHTIAGIEKRLEDFRGYYLSHEDRFSKLSDVFVTRNECLLRSQKDEKLFDIMQARIDRLYGLLDDLSKRISSTRETIFMKDQSRLPDRR